MLRGAYIYDQSDINAAGEAPNGSIQPMGLDFWGHGTGGGNTCKYVTGAALCANGVINVSVNWGGFGGYSIDGNVVGIIVEQSPDTKNPKVRTRVRVKTYGVVGGSTIFL